MKFSVKDLFGKCGQIRSFCKEMLLHPLLNSNKAAAKMHKPPRQTTRFLSWNPTLPLIYKGMEEDGVSFLKKGEFSFSNKKRGVCKILERFKKVIIQRQ